MKRKILMTMTAMLMAGVLFCGADTDLLAAGPGIGSETENAGPEALGSEAVEPEAEEIPEDIEMLWGVWRYVWYENHDYAIEDEIILMPDGTIILPDLEKSVKLGNYKISNNKFTITDLNEETASVAESITGEFLPVESGDLTAYKLDSSNSRFCLNTDQDKKLIMTVTVTDTADPLAPKLNEFRTVFMKEKIQSEFLEELLLGKTWDIDGKVLTITSDGMMDLDNGSRTGKFAVMQNNIKFIWDGGGRISYSVEKITKDSITLRNDEDAGQTITLTLNTEAPVTETDTK